MKIAITGGHIAPALALTDALLSTKDRNKSNVEIIFIGREFTSRNEEKKSWEHQEVTKRGIPFYHLEAGRFTRDFSASSFTQLTLVPFGFLAAYRLLRQTKPDIVMSFGGYIALPVCLVAYLLGIPYYSHEQTIAPGIANRIIGIFAKKMFVAFPETRQFFPKNKTIVSGNLLRQSIFDKTSSSFSFVKKNPVIYITGGSLGSHSINDHVKHILKELLQDTIVIHQTGNVKEFNDHYNLLKIRDALPKELQKRYYVREHISDDDIGKVYDLADVVVSRAGANTFSELIALHKPAVLVPLPWSANDEQLKHAEFFKHEGVGEVFDQYGQSKDLLIAINNVLKNTTRYKSHFARLKKQYQKDAVSTVLHEILKTP